MKQTLKLLYKIIMERGINFVRGKRVKNLSQCGRNENRRRIIDLPRLLHIMRMGARVIGVADCFVIASNRRLTWMHIRCEKVLLGAGFF
jgi:uncharacterized protein (DUF983 family)